MGVVTGDDISKYAWFYVEKHTQPSMNINTKLGKEILYKLHLVKRGPL